MEKIKIPIQISEDKIIFIDTNLNEPVLEIKKKIFYKTGIHILSQQLICEYFNLIDEQTLGYFGKKNPQVSFKIIPVEKFLIFISLFTGKTIHLYVKLTDNIEIIKNQIFSSEGISVNKQKLFFKGEELNNNITIGETLISRESILDLIYKSDNGIIIFFINFDEKKVPFDVKHSDTIHNIKLLIQIKENIPPDQSILFFGNKLLEDNKTLADYNIKDGSIIEFSFKSKGGMKIFLKTLTGKTVTIEANPEDIVNNLKQTIYQTEMIPPKEQHIIFNGKELRGNITLKDYGIKEYSTVHLVLKLRG